MSGGKQMDDEDVIKYLCALENPGLNYFKGVVEGLLVKNRKVKDHE